MALGTNTDPEWSQAEFEDEVMLAARFDVVEPAVEIEEAYAYDYDEFYDYEPSPYDGTYSEE